jgi:hypothetical protein
MNQLPEADTLVIYEHRKPPEASLESQILWDLDRPPTGSSIERSAAKLSVVVFGKSPGPHCHYPPTNKWGGLWESFYRL